MQILRANSLDLSDYVDVTQSIEVSRFAISKEFRQSGQLHSSTHARLASRREADLAFLSLLRFALRESLKRRLPFWTAVMEPKFLRLLARYGISYTTIGPMVEHHGIRQPCYGYIPETLDRVRRVRPDCWEALTETRVH
jgi:N-acyl amino acid synthase of PEP-CTERM/exosortase system